MNVPLNKLLKRSLRLSLLLLLPAVLLAQGVVIPQRITRSKMWIFCNPNGSLERDQSMANTWLLAYPGYADHNNEASGGWDNNLVLHGALINGEEAAWKYRNGNFDDNDMENAVASKLTKNYNFSSSVNEPEEYITGTIRSLKIGPSGKRHMSYTLEGKVMGWSHPKYDDFIIIKCKLTNTDDAAFKDFYYARMVQPSGPWHPSNISPGWDKEYRWDAAVSKDIGFIFYDADTKSPTGSNPAYTVPPGNVTGNAGDPGNIGTQGSRNFKLYSPSLYAYSFIPSSLTANKNGQRKVWRTIVSSSNNAPPEEFFPFPLSADLSYSMLKDFVTGNEQPEISWSDANKVYVAGNKAGSLWERNPAYVYAIGPYDIAPGQSIEWIEIFLCGQMDRNVTMRGDTTATLHFVEEGLKNLKDNWAAAQALMANSYKIPAGQIPPASPADAPRIGNSNELKVVPAVNLSGSTPTVGVTLTWRAVHRGYRDPQTLKNDFAAYKIYRSDNSIEGPWELVRTLPWTSADSFYTAGSISYFLKALGNVPYRYCVTSVDSAGNESGMTGYNFYPVAAEPEPSNNLSDILVVPNPFRQVSGFPDQNDNKRLAFVNIPSKCTIRIYTLALDLVKQIEHDGGGIHTWGSQLTKDYMLTEFGQNVMPGVYVFHVESHVPGHEGETSVGKFVIIK